ncbi:hypothetical protein J4206_00010 [Candidatus Woesearchaeota archaeon]|nr:hypothetical protein [Candidatus Woesearchaeota archaeon]
MSKSGSSKHEKVNVEVLDEQGNVVDTSHPAVKKFRKIKNRVVEKTSLYWKRTKLTIAILLDLVGLFIGWLPLVNTGFSILCFVVLLVLLKNKKIALLSLIEVPLIIPPFSFIAMILPICTLCVMIDNSLSNIKDSQNGSGGSSGIFKQMYYYR